MKRNLDQVMLDLDGKSLGDKATLKTVCFSAMVAPLEGDQAMTVEVKMKQYALLQAINKGGVVELTAEDIALLKARAAKCLMLVAFGRLCEMLEQEYHEPADLKVVEN
jgi:hypothetical protein